MTKPKNIAEYIALAPTESQKNLREMYLVAKKLVLDAEEGLKWNMPAFSLKRILFTFAGFKHHIGFYPTPSVIEAFAKDLKGYVTKSGSVQFPHDQSLPVVLIKKMIQLRVDQSKNEDVKWRV
jgi:uncharacterized protein YdhG (YjbR/CyaY superfamily)